MFGTHSAEEPRCRVWWCNESTTGPVPALCKRWFLEHPFAGDGKTYVLSKMWGTMTAQRLADLSQAFPECKVAFRPADPDS